MIKHGRIGLRCHVHYLRIHTVADVYPVHGTAVRLHRNNVSVMESLMLNEWKPTAGRCRGCLSETFTGCSETGCESSSAFLLLTCCCALCSSVLSDGCDVLKEAWKSRVRCFCVDVSEAISCYLSLGCFCILLSLLSVIESLHLPAAMNMSEFIWVTVVQKHTALTANMVKIALRYTWCRSSHSVQIGSAGHSVDSSMLSLCACSQSRRATLQKWHFSNWR